MGYTAESIKIRVKFTGTSEGEKFDDTLTTKLNRAVTARYRDDMWDNVQEDIDGMTAGEWEEVITAGYGKVDNLTVTGVEILDYTVHCYDVLA